MHVFEKSLLLSFLSLIFVGTAAKADNSWSTYHWSRMSNPFTLEVMDYMTPDWDGFLSLAASDWSASVVLDTVVVPGADDRRARTKCEAVTGKLKACNAAYGRNGWLGLAQIWLTSGHIIKATTKVNDSYFNMSAYNNPNAKRHVLCQELGHDLGLDHQRETTAVTCMNDIAGIFDPSYVSPNAHDFLQLETIYGGHFDVAASTSATSASSNQNENDQVPCERGNGRSSVCVEALGHDSELVTFVLWAE